MSLLEKICRLLLCKTCFKHSLFSWKFFLFSFDKTRRLPWTSMQFKSVARSSIPCSHIPTKSRVKDCTVMEGRLSTNKQKSCWFFSWSYSVWELVPRSPRGNQSWKGLLVYFFEILSTHNSRTKPFLKHEVLLIWSWIDLQITMLLLDYFSTLFI